MNRNIYEEYSVKTGIRIELLVKISKEAAVQCNYLSFLAVNLGKLVCWPYALFQSCTSKMYQIFCRLSVINNLCSVETQD